MGEIPKINKGERSPNMEVEQKYLIASEVDAKKLEAKIAELFPDARLVGAWSETSYYLSRITKEKARELLVLVVRLRGSEDDDLLAQLDRVPEGTPIQMRFRHRKNREDSSFLFTLKAGANPLHDIERIEIETSDVSDAYIEGFAANGVEPESIWHSMRREYAVDENTKIDVQNVTGYGWTAEVESVDINTVQVVAAQLGLQPLTHELLDEMYTQYKEHWREYYGAEGNAGHFSETDWSDIEDKAKQKRIENSF